MHTAASTTHQKETEKNVYFILKVFFLGRVVEMSGDERHVAGQDAEKYIYFFMK